MAAPHSGLTNEERRKRLSHHVVHDYVNLVSAGTEIARSHPPPLNSHMLYSFIVQYRKFADFFANKRKRMGRKRCRLLNLLSPARGTTEATDIDVLAKDFVSGKIRYELREWRKWEHHMNTHLFHINTFRTRNTRPWEGHTEVRQMLKEFQAAWKRFFDGLPEALKAEFKEEIELKVTPPSEFANLDLYKG
jgi:hypothetical protein